MIIPAIAILAVVYGGITSRIQVSKKVIWRDGLTLILTEFLFILMISGNALYWYHGVFLMGIYVVYLIYMLTSMSKGKKISHEDYRQVLSSGTVTMSENKSIRSFNRTLYSINVRKQALSSFDDKKFILENGIDTLSYGHFKLRD